MDERKDIDPNSNLAAMYRMRRVLHHYFSQSPHELRTSDLDLLDSVIEEAEGMYVPAVKS